MAVAPMTRAQIVAYSAVSDDVVRRIYDLGLLQAVEVVEKTEPESELHEMSDDLLQKIAELDGKLREVHHALAILDEHDEAGRELIENFVTLKQRVSRQTVTSVREQFDFLEVSQQIGELEEQLKHLEEQQGWLHDDRDLLETLAPLPFPLKDLRSTRWVSAVVGRLRKENQAALEAELATCEEDVFWEQITIQGQFVYLFILSYPSGCFSSSQSTSGIMADASEQERTEILKLLERHGFDTLDLSAFSEKIPEELQRIEQQRAELQTQIDELTRKLRDQVQYKERFHIIEEYLANEIDRYKDLQNFAASKQVYFIEGWMKQRDKLALEQGLGEFQEAIEVFYVDPDEDDETIPVILENPSYLQPFELITRMFGMPKYNEPDPTPFLAPFFALFFGLCLTDAGYGLMLSLFMVWLMRKYVFDAGTVQLARLLYYGGLATILCGALTGGWFGNILDSLPNALSFVTAVKNSLVIINPMEEPIVFLIIALILGYIQVCYGIFLKMQHRMRRGDATGALLDEGLWMVFINSLFFWGIISASGIGDLLIGQGLVLLCQFLALISGGARVWLHDRENPNVVVRVLSGLYSLYDIVGIFSDVLSYSRLLALGLATGVIAMIVDMLALMTSGVPGIGFIIGIVIFCFGHVFNLIINTLGAFIHSGRLQFVEFFSKFFQAGGKRYKPFKFESRYFEITD
ncbi:hypothetical protein GF339_18710 [candidate division KSB3 bacterium]|uniref:V-type ATP synthase subunit I n=1 Tax=candidate division KSB3 bacterium TaxID=2044937 RepID=A0A9D5Q7S9_9BACT|nr:hypothetical protein [candidate division KSB3 bacterium]MBD3326622.1 hypothetical protein [candidate division KSB3 bacterium]